MIELTVFALLCVFYGAYLAKLLAQRRQGIDTNVMIRGRKSPRAYGTGILLNLATYLTCGVQFLSCLFWRKMGGLAAAEPVRILGVVLLALGDLFFVAAFVTLKDSWRAGIDETQQTELVTTGIYRHSRNPAFVGFDLGYIGCALAVGNGVMAAAAGISIVLLHLQILEEEKHLEKMFGQPYRQYRGKVRRYL